MRSKEFKENFKVFCVKIGKKNFIIAGAVLLIAAALIVNFTVLSSKKGDDGYDYDQSAGITDNAGNIVEPPGKSGIVAEVEYLGDPFDLRHSRTEGNSAAKLNDGDHGAEKNYN